jgi:CheY-like chemotaxis protein
MMPEVTGIDVHDAVRAIDPALLARIVFMTGGAFTDEARRFLADVNPRLIEKPFQAGELVAIVNATRPR